jgi:hypothetical protein
MQRPYTKNQGGGYVGLAEEPGTPDGTKFLRDDGTWQNTGDTLIGQEVAASNVQDLIVTGLTGNDKRYEVSFEAFTDGDASGGFLSIYPNGVTDALSFVLHYEGSSAGNLSGLVIDLGQANGDGFVGGTIVVEQRNGSDWMWTLVGAKRDNVSQWALYGSGSMVAGSLSTIRIHTTVASGIRTGSYLRVVEAASG